MATSSKSFIRRLERAGYRPQSYSGRCMYGARCVAVVLDRGESLTVGKRSATWDSMGLGSVAYWPALDWPADMVESDSEEE